MNENLRKLHESLRRDYGDNFTVDYDTFVNDMRDEGKRTRLYQNLRNDYGDNFTRSFDEFSSDIGVSVSTKDEVPFYLQRPAEEASGVTAFQGHEDPYLRGFIPNVKQGTKGLVEGSRVMAGTTANLFTGSSHDAVRAMEILDKHGAEGYNPRKAYRKDLEDKYDAEMAEYEKQMKEWREKHPGVIDRAKSMLPLSGDMPKKPKNPFVSGQTIGETGIVGDRADMRAYRLVEEALKKGGGDLGKAKEYLSGKQGEKTWGDRAEERGAEELSKLKQPKGFAGWVGNLVPQMVPNALAIAASVHPTTRPLSRPLGALGMGMLSTASGGHAIADARQYAKDNEMDIPESDVVKAGLLATAIEVGTEMIPFSRYMSGAASTVRRRLGKQVSKEILSNKKAVKEVNDLLNRAAKNIPGSLGKETAAEWAKDLTAESLSEFAAESLDTLVPTLYANREDYPELSAIIANGFEGAKAGLFMGAFLGTGSRLANTHVQNQRRKEQGNVTFADTGKGVVEILGQRGDNFVVLNQNGEVTDIPKDAITDVATVDWAEFKEYADGLKKGEEVAAPVTEEARAATNAIMESIVNPGLKKGTNPMDQDTHVNARVDLERTRSALGEALKDAKFVFDERVFAMPAEQQKALVAAVIRDEALGGEQKQAIVNHIISFHELRQLEQSRIEAIEADIARVGEANAEMVNETTGTLVSAFLKGSESETPVAITKGMRLKQDEANPDAPYSIDVENSDEAIYYIDENGATQVATADSFELYANETVEEATEKYRAHVLEQEEIAQAAIAESVAARLNAPVESPVETPSAPVEETAPVGPGFGDTAVMEDGTNALVVEVHDDGTYTLELESPTGEITETTVPAEELGKYGFEVEEPAPVKPTGQPTTEESSATSAPTEAEALEREKEQFMASLPVFESGKNAGQVDQSQMTPGQNLRYFEYEVGKEKTAEMAAKQAAILKKKLDRERAKLDNDPFNIVLNQDVNALQTEYEAYQLYADQARVEKTRRYMEETKGEPSVVDAREQRGEEIAAMESGRVGYAGAPVINRWDNAIKVEGIKDVITLANGEKIEGVYVLTTADAPSPSHNFANFAKTEGFPVNEHGKTVNDRDYEADQAAQTIVRQRANKYDERAVQTPVVVSQEGVVLSGNDRTMAGQLAAMQGTDKAYTDYITEYASRWGFSPKQVKGMKNPRIVFMPFEAMPYDTNTFAKFNAEEKKTQGGLERAIKASKSVSREAIIPIAQIVDGFEKLNDYYNSEAAAKQTINVLLDNGVIGTNEVPGMMDGNVLSVEGRSFVETLMLGAVLNEDALRQVDQMRAAKQTLMRSMPQLMRNGALNEYSLLGELNNAVLLLYEAKQSGNVVELQLRQGNLFEASAAEIYNEIEQILANLLENAKDTEIRAIFEVYNERAANLEAGQADMFDGLLTKPELLQRIIDNYYGREQEKGGEQAGSTVTVDQRGPGQDEQGGAVENEGSRESDTGGQGQVETTADALSTTFNGDVAAFAQDVVKSHEIAREAEKVDTQPTDGQKEAGNYQKGHIKVQGFDITIENPKGSVRSGVDADGKPWETTMNHHYGYFKRSQGKDGDKIDVFIGNNEKALRSLVRNGKRVAIVTPVGEHKLTPEKRYTSTREAIEKLKETTEQEEAEAAKKAEKTKLEQLEEERDQALKDFLDAFNDLKSDNLGIIDTTAEKQAKMLVAGTRLIGTYTKLGVYKFGEILKNIKAKGIQVTEDLLTALKSAYGAFVANNDIAELDDIKTVREFKLEDLNEEAPRGQEAEIVKPGPMPQVTAPVKSDRAYKAINELVENLEELPMFENRRSGKYGDAFMPFNVEKQGIGDNNIFNDPRAFTLITEQNYMQMGDLMTDPRIDWAVFPTYGIMIPINYEQNGMGIFQEFVREGKIVNVPGARDVLNFATGLWFPNLKRQGRQITKIQQDESKPTGRDAEAIAVEAEAIERASDAIRSESEDAGSDRQRAGEIKERADEQIEKVETLLNEIDNKLANLRLSDKNYSTEGIVADYPISVLAKGVIKRDATKFVKAVAEMTGLEHDTDKKGKPRILNVNIAPAGGNVTFILWSKANPEYGVYVSIPYEPGYGDGGYDNYKVKGTHILWRVTTRDNKWTGARNQWANTDVTAQELAETLINGLNDHFKSINLPAEAGATPAYDGGSIAEFAGKVVERNEKRRKRQNKRPKSGESQGKDVPLQGSLFTFEQQEHGSNEDGGTDHSRTEPGREKLPETVQVGTGTPAENATRDREGKRRNVRKRRGEPGSRPEHDVNKSYTNEEIHEIVSSVTGVKDGKIEITGEVTDDVKTIASHYVSGGIAKEGRGILDEYYTDAKIVEVVGDLISKYFPKNKRLRVLEPSVGTGNFLQAIPQGKQDVVTFEINETTAKIAKIFHPNAEVNLRSFETEFIDDAGKKKPMPAPYDLVLGNPPYGEHRGVYRGLGEESGIAKYEDYFVKRGLDVLNEGGILAMVLPSGWMNRHKRESGYTIENAYRLPSGAFKGTEIGTDIVILRKRTGHEAADEHNWFEKHPGNVLGEVKERSNRFGRMEEYIEGDIDDALERIRQNEARQVAGKLDIEPTADNLNDIANAIDETGSEEKAEKLVKATREPVKKTTRATIKKDKLKTTHSKGDNVVPASLQFPHEFTSGEVDAFRDANYDGTLRNPGKHKAHASYHAGRWVHDFYYAEGNIYDKLEQLERDKGNITKEQYEKQRKMLEKVLPEKKTIENINISPNTEFVANLTISTPRVQEGRGSLKDIFLLFAAKLPSEAFGDSHYWEVRDYVNNYQVYGTDKNRNQLVRDRRKAAANDLFGKFLKEELDDRERSQVVNAFNREYNAIHRPDYSRVPLFSEINENFKGKPLKLTEVQLAGIGMLTVKAVGLLAHEVGFGKTLSGVIAMHEAMTRGFAEKPLIVVPNNSILEQWIETIREIIPESTINNLGNLGVKYDLTDFTVNPGEITIVTYAGFKALGFKPDTYDRLSGKFEYITDELKKHKSAREQEIEKAKRARTKGKMMRGATYNFEDFGFDFMTFDEVHNANHIVGKVKLDKKVASDFRSQNQRTSDLGIKTWLASQYLQEQNNGRNVVLLSATPFTNKPLEYYSILSLVANKTLERMGFFRVDQFFETFMEADNDLEIKADGRPVQKTNVRRFRNNGLFQQLLGEFIDIKGEEDNPDLQRPERFNKEYVVTQNDLTAETMAVIQDLLTDNETVLQGITHARAAAFSPYASDFCPERPKNHVEFVKNSPKIDATVRLVERNRKDNPGAGQIIYSELGIEFFPMIRDYLVKESKFNPKEVAIITGATSATQRAKIQTDFNNGVIKVVIGSPAIKEGMNLQANTTDMYILSLPYNFTQLRQVEGRGWRQGYKWDNIRINYMLTDDSSDVFMLQRLQVKQGLYNEAMKEGAETVDVSDIDTGELKTALIKDPDVRAEIELMIEKERLETEKTRIQSDLAFVNRKYEQYNKQKEKVETERATLENVKNWAEKGGYWEMQLERYEKDFEKAERDLDAERQKLAEKGVKVDDIINQEQQAKTRIADIEARIEGLKDRHDELAEKYRKENQSKAAERENAVDRYVQERAEENKTFYNLKQEPGEDASGHGADLEGEAMFRVTGEKGASKREVDQVSLKAIETVLEKAGIPVEYVTDEEAVKKYAEARKKATAPETVYSLSEKGYQQTVISSADGAKVLQNLEKLKEKLLNFPTHEKTFIGETAKALNINKDIQHKASQYATFETKNGKIVTIRLSNHNATVSNFDNHGEKNGISIVVTPKENLGITNDGNAHVVEYFYDAIKLRRAEGKPLAEIITSIQQALYSGEYKDTTGLAEVEEVNARNVQFHTGWHGSPHEFDRFSTDYMGTGEGAQAYGWGLYFTDKEGIGRQYARKLGLGAIKNLNVNGISLYENGEPTNYDYRVQGEHLAMLQEQLFANEQLFAERLSPDEMLEGVQGWFDNEINNAKEEAKDDDYYDGYVEVLEKHRPENLADIKLERNKDRNLYKVKIHGDKTVDELNFMRWDKPLTEKQMNDIAIQSDKDGYIDDLSTLKINWENFALKYKDGRVEYGLREDLYGQDVYKQISKRLGSEKEASLFLLRAGIDGIQYPTEFLSKGEHEDSYNYVVFDENALEIDEHIRFFTRPGHVVGGKRGKPIVYGWMEGGKVYLVKERVNPETPIHEYSHLWDIALEKNNPLLWRHGVELFKQTDLWGEIVNDPNYSYLNNDSQVASEVKARLTGKEGAEVFGRMQRDAKETGDMTLFAKATRLINDIKNWLKDAWYWLMDTMTPWKAEDISRVTIDDLVNMTIGDMVKGKSLDGVEARDGLADDARFRSLATEAARPLERLMPRREDLRVVKKKWEERRVMKHVDMRREIFANGVHNLEMPKDREIVKPVNPLVNIYNFAYSNYRSAGPDFLRPIFRNKNLIGLKPDRNGYPILDVESAKKFKEIFDKNIDSYEKFLQYSKYISTEAAQREINDLLDDIDYARWYYSELAEGKDVWRTENDPRFRVEEDPAGFEVEGKMDGVIERPKYVAGMSMAEFARQMVEYNEKTRNMVNFTLGIPKPPTLNSMMSAVDVAFVMDAFNSQKNGVLKEVNKEMAKISRWYTAFIDRARPLEKLLSLMAREGAKLTDETNAYYDFITSASQATSLINEYEKTRIEPLQETLRKVAKVLDTTKDGKKPTGEYRWNVVDEATGDVINKKPISTYDKISLYLQARDIVEADMLQGVAARGARGFENNVRDANGKGVTPDAYIAEFEAAIGKKLIDEEWEHVRAVNRWALDLQYKHGMIDAETYYEYTSGKREYYVPQRGWRERDLSDRQLYYVTDKDESPNNPFNAALIKARGRQTLAGDPLAYMQSIGESSVMAAMKNQTKQKFLKFAEENADFARAHDFFGFKQVYYVSTGKLNENGEMIYERTYERPPEWHFEDDKKIYKAIRGLQEQREQATLNYNTGKIKKAAYERLMTRLAQRERNAYNNLHVKHVDSEASRIAQLTAAERGQHNVVVLRDGKEYEIVFTKNYDGERVANVLNRNFGKPDHSDLHFMQQVSEGLRKGTRFMSAMMTQYNPTFAVANFIRDWGVASIGHLQEFGVDYQLQFTRNTFHPQLQGAVWRYAFAEQFKTGKEFKDAEGNKYDRYLKEFFEDGAQTGWSFLKDIDQLRTDMKRAITPTAKDVVLHGRFGVTNAGGLRPLFGTLTEASELITRFATYVTSREQKNVDGSPKYSRVQSAMHSKEASVNFDRKGTQRFFGTLFSFFNATVQGSNKIFRMVRDPRVKKLMIATTSLLMAGGALQALMMPDPDDDDEREWTEWELMNNLCMGKVKIPLPQTLRAFWGFGVQAGLAYRGKKGVSEALLDGTKYFFGEIIPEQLIFWMNGIEIDERTEKLTYNPTMAVRGATPTTIQPLFDVWQNTNFMGGTSYRTEFTNATKGTQAERTLGKRNVSDGAQFVSDVLWVWGGGDTKDRSRLKKDDTAVVAGIFDINPSAIETITRGYAAGTGKFVLDMFTLGTQVLDPEKSVDVSGMAIANVLWKQPREYSPLERKLWTLRDKTDFYKNQFNEIKKNNPERYRRITSFHASEHGDLLRYDPGAFYRHLERFGTDENKMFGLLQQSEQLQKRIEAGLIGGKEAELEVEVLLDRFKELQ